MACCLKEMVCETHLLAIGKGKVRLAIGATPLQRGRGNIGRDQEGRKQTELLSKKRERWVTRHERDTGDDIKRKRRWG